MCKIDADMRHTPQSQEPRPPDVHRQLAGAYKNVRLIHLSKTKIILDYTIGYFHYAGQPLHSHRVSSASSPYLHTAKLFTRLHIFEQPSATAAAFGVQHGAICQEGQYGWAGN